MPSLNLFADLQQLPAIHDFVDQAGRDLGLDERTLYTLQMVVGEACTNVIMHAYGGKGGEVVLTIESTANGLEVRIRDWGEPFDPLNVPTPDVSAPLEQRPLGGLGLFLMRQMMDQVDFRFDEEEGNTLTMTKRTRTEAQPKSQSPGSVLR